jgi:hypothetical protein
MSKNEIKEFILWLLIGFIVSALLASALSLLDREPIKERQQYVVIKSIGVYHKYIVDGKNVKIEYEEVE